MIFLHEEIQNPKNVMISSLITLFVLGFSFATFGDSLLINNNLTFNPSKTSGWIATSSGFAACFIGLLYPFIDYIIAGSSTNRSQSKNGLKRGEESDTVRRKNSKGWIKTVRCLGCFLALLYALSKLNTTTKTSSIIISTLSIAMWYEFDKTYQGLIISIIVAICGSVCVGALCSQGFYV